MNTYESDTVPDALQCRDPADIITQTPILEQEARVAAAIGVDLKDPGFLAAVKAAQEGNWAIIPGVNGVFDSAYAIANAIAESDGAEIPEDVFNSTLPEDQAYVASLINAGTAFSVFSHHNSDQPADHTRTLWVPISDDPSYVAPNGLPAEGRVPAYHRFTGPAQYLLDCGSPYITQDTIIMPELIPYMATYNE